MALVLIMEVNSDKSRRLASLWLLVGFALLMNGCLHTDRDDLTSPKATVVIRLQPMDFKRFRATSRTIKSTIANRRTSEFRYRGPAWRLKRLSKNVRYGTCRVYFRSRSLNRAEVLQLTEEVAEVLKQRFEGEGLGGLVAVEVE